MSINPGPGESPLSVETEALMAALRDDEQAAADLVAQLTIGECMSLLRAADLLAEIVDASLNSPVSLTAQHDSL